ncbi:jg7385 [Pararge aegeria aegeria]|uniref:Jg7385 protein n=1 Tax=Pararge aegeria aegeria TaxID=348720 RepID=A0A8S4SPT9_9NEOP|nr:jg7385 [Pararge aegeria aegeria]
MLRAEGPRRWVWEEQRDLMAMEFRFKDAQEPRALVVGHVHLLQEFPMQDILSTYYLLSDWRPDLIEELLSLLTPDNVRVGVVANPLAYAEPASCNLTSVWVLLLRDSLQQFAYAAELAGLRWSVGNAKYGLSITIDGYDDKLHVLLEKLIEHIVGFKADPQRFAIMKESHIRAIKNFEAEQPYQHAVYQQALCLSDLVWTRCQLVESAESKINVLVYNGL